MTKNEFMEKLAKELKARGVADAADIEEEYEQHFAFKLADGYAEEEIAAKLGDPAKLAAQFTAESAPAGRSGRKAAVVTGLVFLDIVTVLGFIALAAFALVLAAAAIGFAAIGVSLITKTSLYGVIPTMPYGSALLLGAASLALAVLTGIGCAWYAAFVRQSVRAFCRFQANAVADAEGKATLPALPMQPQFAAKCARRMRRCARASLIVFVVALVIGFVVSAFAAGSIEFWHVWGWFTNKVHVWGWSTVGV